MALFSQNTATGIKLSLLLHKLPYSVLMNLKVLYYFYLKDGDIMIPNACRHNTEIILVVALVQAVLLIVIFLFTWYIKGVLHPRPILWLFVYFSQKLHLIGDKLDMFCYWSHSKEHNQLKLLIYGSEHGKYWFLHFIYSNLTTLVSK